MFQKVEKTIDVVFFLVSELWSLICRKERCVLARKNEICLGKVRPPRIELGTPRLLVMLQSDALPAELWPVTERASKKTLLFAISFGGLAGSIFILSLEQEQKLKF